MTKTAGKHRRIIPAIEFENLRGRYITEKSNKAYDERLSFLYKFFYIPHLDAFENCSYRIEGKKLIKFYEEG